MIDPTHLQSDMLLQTPNSDCGCWAEAQERRIWPACSRLMTAVIKARESGYHCWRCPGWVPGHCGHRTPERWHRLAGGAHWRWDVCRSQSKTSGCARCSLWCPSGGTVERACWSCPSSQTTGGSIHWMALLYVVLVLEDAPGFGDTHLRKKKKSISLNRLLPVTFLVPLQHDWQALSKKSMM